MEVENRQEYPGLASVSIPAYLSADRARRRYLAGYREAIAFTVREHGSVKGIVRRERIERLSDLQGRLVTVGDLVERLPISPDHRAPAAPRT